MRIVQLITLLLVVNGNLFYAQTKRFQLIDSLNRFPVQYANIKSVASDFGTSSDTLGNFSFDGTATVIINAVGYKKDTVALHTSNGLIQLSPVSLQLDEVVIAPKRNKKELVLDAVNNQKPNQFYGLSASNANASWIIGKYFENKAYKTRFLKNITVYTNSEIDHAIFNVRIYRVKNGKPENELYGENIIGIARKGRNKTRVDLSETGIQIPENGIFIAVDWIKTDQNRYHYAYSTPDTAQKARGVSYAPLFGSFLDDDSAKTMIFKSNQWQPALSDMTQKTDQYCTLAMELVLTD